MKFITIILIFIANLNAKAADQWNTYQWNKKNYFANNGKVDNSPWFEWWYYKITIPETKKSYFFVYGNVNPWDTGHTKMATRSYVGVGDFKRKIQIEEKFNLDRFFADYKNTYINIANNIATDNNFHGFVVDEDGKYYRWNVDIEKKWAFNAEGWMMGTMLTDIEWYPAQADAVCSGTIESDVEVIQFTQAPCYQDRNWGKAFPKWWTWIVANHFTGQEDTALAIGGGQPLIRGRYTPFASVSIGLRHKGKVYSFRPIDMQKVRTNINFGKWEIYAEDPIYKIEIIATAPKEEFMDLQFMTPEGFIFHDYETLNGKVNVKLFKKKAGKYKPFLELTSDYAGIEYGSR